MINEKVILGKVIELDLEVKDLVITSDYKKCDNRKIICENKKY